MCSSDLGTASASAPGSVTVTVDTSGLGAGSYLGSVTVSSPSGSATIPVSLFVAQAGPVLTLSQTGLRFVSADTLFAAPPQTVQILNTGSAGTSINPVVTLVRGADWLSFTASSNPVTPTSLGSITFTPIAGTTRVTTPRYALARVTDANALGSPQYVSIVLDPGSTQVFPSPVPSGVFFTAAARSGVSASQSVTLNTSSSAAVTFQTSSITTDGVNWLLATPASGTVSFGAPAQIAVSVDTTSLIPGVYTGTVNVSIGTNVRAVNVTLVVPPAAGAAEPLLSSNSREAGCSASKLAIEIGRAHV